QPQKTAGTFRPLERGLYRIKEHTAYGVWPAPLILGAQRGCPRQRRRQGVLVRIEDVPPQAVVGKLPLPPGSTRPASVRTLRCWESVACVIDTSRARSPQQRSGAVAMACTIRNRVGSARALVIFMTCCGVISVLVHPNNRHIAICLNIRTAVS